MLPIIRKRSKWSDGLEHLIRELYFKHRNCDVLRHELKKLGMKVPSLRYIQQTVKPLRNELKAQKARGRVESYPGDVMQIDYGVVTLPIAGVPVKVHFFAAVLAYSRRRFVMITETEDSTAWLMGIEGAFKHFGGLPKMILCDNAKALVNKDAHVGGSRFFTPNACFESFCNYWDVKPIASMPFYPQAKGKVEKTVDRGCQRSSVDQKPEV